MLLPETLLQPKSYPHYLARQNLCRRTRTLLINGIMHGGCGAVFNLANRKWAVTLFPGGLGLPVDDEKRVGAFMFGRN